MAHIKNPMTIIIQQTGEGGGSTSSDCNIEKVNAVEVVDELGNTTLEISSYSSSENTYFMELSYVGENVDIIFTSIPDYDAIDEEV